MPPRSFSPISLRASRIVPVATRASFAQAGESVTAPKSRFSNSSALSRRKKRRSSAEDERKRRRKQTKKRKKKKLLQATSNASEGNLKARPGWSDAGLFLFSGSATS